MADMTITLLVLISSTVVSSLNLVPLSTDSPGGTIQDKVSTLEKFHMDSKLPLTQKRKFENRSPRAAADKVTSNPFLFNTGHRDNYAQIYFSGDKSSVMFVLTYNVGYSRDKCTYYAATSELWRSSDYGKTFNRVTPVSDGTNYVLSSLFYISPGDKTKMIFGDERDDRLFITEDEGLNFTSYPVPIDPQTIAFHPTVGDLCMAVKYPSDSRCNDAHSDLYISVDGGKHWIRRQEAQSIKAHVWEDPDYETPECVRGKQGNVTFYYLVEDEGSTSADRHTVYRSSVLPGSDGKVTAKEFDPSLGSVAEFRMMKQFMFANKHNTDGSQTLYVSYKRGPFKKIIIPIADNHQGYYVDIVEGSQVLLLVKHKTATTTSGYVYNLYLSDSEGLSYSLALEDVAYDKRGNFDLEYIEGLPGTFIANQYVSGSSGNGNQVRTLVSFDGGAEWNLVQPPLDARAADGSACSLPLCSLHFHMSASANYSRLGVASWESIPGIIIAHGTVGQKLSANPDLFISRDGGISWEKTLDGTWGVNVMDYGSVIVAARDYHVVESNQIMYTCTEGLSWESYQFSSSSMTVWGVVTEPGETTVVSFLFASVTGRPEWMSVYLNFTHVFARTCGGNDYTAWEPWNDRTDNDQKCLFGETLKIERRKINVCCFNGADYSRNVTMSPCLCTADDYECDVGYKRSGDACVRDSGSISLTTPTCDGTTSSITVSQGYRKIAGDHCINGSATVLDPRTVPCTHTIVPDESGIVILGVVFCIVVVILLGCNITLIVLLIIIFRRYRKASSSYQLLSGGPTRYNSGNTEELNPNVEFDGDEEILEP